MQSGLYNLDPPPPGSVGARVLDLCDECGAPMLDGSRCTEGCHVFIPTRDDTGECVNCLRAEAGLDPIAPDQFVVAETEDERAYWGNP
jgi:hypothetical protein